MISEKRKQAARANGARSRGPVTPEGKAISSRNAMRHGLLSKSVVLCNEDETVFGQLFYLLVNRFNPVDDIEMSAIEEMAAAHWRMRRVMAMEQSILNAGVLAHLGKAPSEQTAAVFSDPANQTTLVLLQRYEVRFQHMYHRALRSLAALRKLPCRELVDQDLAGPDLPGPDLPITDLPIRDLPSPKPAMSAEPNEPKPPSVCNTADPSRVPAPALPDLEPLTSGGGFDDRLWLSVDLRR